MGDDSIGYMIVVILMFFMLLVVAFANSQAGHDGERDKIKDAIINNPNITCIEYLKMEGE